MLQAVEWRGQLLAQVLAVAIGHYGIVPGGNDNSLWCQCHDVRRVVTLGHEGIQLRQGMQRLVETGYQQDTAHPAGGGQAAELAQYGDATKAVAQQEGMLVVILDKAVHGLIPGIRLGMVRVWHGQHLDLNTAGLEFLLEPGEPVGLGGGGVTVHDKDAGV